MRIGVIGVGRIGAHARRAARAADRRAPSWSPSRTPTRRRRARSPPSSACAAAGVEELLAAADVDAVAICSSTDTHADLIVAAARAGKAIFCEKPVSLDLAEVDRALAAVDGARACRSRSASTAASTRPTRRCATRSSAGAVGEPQLVRISSRDPAPPPLAYVEVSGGIFLDMTIHDFDMARYVAGSRGGRGVRPRRASTSTRASREAGDVDTALVTLVHENGCLTAIDNSRQAVYGFDQRVEVFGSAGMAASENPLAHTARRAHGGGHARRRRCRTSTSSATCPSYMREWEAFVGRPSSAAQAPPVTAADARAPLVIGLAAWRSLREHRPVARGGGRGGVRVRMLLTGASGFVGSNLARGVRRARRRAARARRTPSST